MSVRKMVVEENNIITVYWSTPAFAPNQESWNMLYREPEPVLNDFLNKRAETKNPRKTVYACPATNDFLKNVFVIKSNLDDYAQWPEGYLEQVNDNVEDQDAFNHDPKKGAYLQPFGNKMSLWCARHSAVEGYADITYNMSWIFFADEPLTMRFSAPYYPASSPAEGAILASGQFDIGQWFRPFNLNYFIPYTTSRFEIKIDDPLVYIQALTDKRIQFKRFNYSSEIMTMSNEFVTSPYRYGNFMPLYKRYEMAKNANMRSIVLNEIKKNLVN